MGSKTVGKKQPQKIEGTRADKKIECYPVLGAEVTAQIDALAKVRGLSRAAMTAAIAHHCLWSQRIIDQLQPYLQIAAALTWDTSVTDNVFHCWLASKTVRDIRPCMQTAREDGQRVKFRISLEDRQRLQVLTFSLGGTSADALWPVLLGLALTDGQSVYAVTRTTGLKISARHPLSGEWVTAQSFGTVL